MTSLVLNSSARTALRSLAVARSELSATQFRIASGLKVAAAKDNPAFFLVANTVRSDTAITRGRRDNLVFGTPPPDDPPHRFPPTF
ncbi:MAG: hypothetical protein V2I43_08510 [Parvularcula sp.]|jgi:flagellin|nr:hypothetical protein [Parvularcula sp.]